MCRNITDYQAIYIANFLTRRLPANDIDKLTASLQDAQVDLTPHQVEAALFAFKSPLSKGAILADEVGLGKTIEAGIILSQHWSEHKEDYLLSVQPIYENSGQVSCWKNFTCPLLLWKPRPLMPP